MAIRAFDFTAASISFCILFASTAARDIRPSDHGLGYSPPAGEAPPPAMMSFFGASSSNSSSPPSPSWPKASNSTDNSWMSPAGGGGRTRVREILLVASLVCGVTGVGLLVGSGLFFLFKFGRERRSTPKSTAHPQSRPPQTAARVDNYQ